MSLRTLPLVIINLGGEMLYILDQRLQVQTVPPETAKKVMNDIIATMFSKSFMEELFRPQELYSKRTLQAVLNRLAHSSIMRLNPASMDKLYDLMAMAFKYQVVLCPRPKDLLLVTFNHMDAVRGFVRDSPAVLNQVDEIHRQLVETYGLLSGGEFQLIRQTLLAFCQDLHIRVTVFLRDQIQSSNGRFVLYLGGPVPCGSEVPGLIRLFKAGRVEVQRFFPSGGSYTCALQDGSFQLSGHRAIKLGTNMYSTSCSAKMHISGTESPAQHSKVNTGPNLLAKEELNLLATLMGQPEVQSSAKLGSLLHVNLFATDEEEKHMLQKSEAVHSEIINIQATKDEEVNAELARIMGEFEHEEEAAHCKGDDLLALMDDL